ncbi:MAG: beta-galactosidase [Sphingomonadaceae bacterium]
MSRQGLRALVAAGLAVVAIPAPAQAPVSADWARATRFANKPSFAFGAAWYPEQWPETRWDTDLTLMRKAGFNTVRIGEFAWSTIEPREGEFHFAWLDRAISAAARHGMMVVIGTPTASPPAWMTQKYPDILRVDEDGAKATHGNRRHFSFASPRYRQFARDIATRLAERYGQNPTVVGWQIDNEVGPPSFGPAAVKLWHEFLRARYGTIDNLNKRWATQYWSQYYNDFDQVPLHATGQQNPGLLLDFKHFTTATWTSYVMNQADAIRAHADPRQFVTTNTMFWNGGYDHFKLHRGLDIAAWDDYIQTDPPEWTSNAANHDLVRGYKQRNFWVMETQAGRIDWVSVNRALRPGQTIEMGWQAIEHGADAILYWEFRPARNGQETYYGTVVGQDGEPNPIFTEIAKLGQQIHSAQNALAGTQPQAKVGFLFSYDSRWAIDLQRLNKNFDPINEFIDFYRPFRMQSQGVAVLPPSADLSAYPLIVAPALNVITQSEADHLTAYVRAGGHLVLGPRSGMKDGHDALWPERQPGPLRSLLGAQVEQFYALDKPVNVTGDFGKGKASIWAEWLRPEAKNVQILARYSDPGGWLDGKAAMVTRQIGKGSITYIGAWFDDDVLTKIASKLLADADIKAFLPNTDPDLEIGLRAGEGKSVLIAINHGNAPHKLPVPSGARLLTGALQDGAVPAHSVAVLSLPYKD